MKLYHTLTDVPLYLGWLVAEGVSPQVGLPSEWESSLSALLEERAQGLTPEQEERRQLVRRMLRQGRYRPTGRGKPASEYLLRAAREGNFPRINSLVDLGNWLSLKSLLPLSVWDVDKAAAENYLLRLGKEGEAYVFNQTGQTIRLHDLVLVAREQGGESEPIANPVKDCLATKTDETTKRVAVVVYVPTQVPAEELMELLEDFAQWLRLLGDEVSVQYVLLKGGEEKELSS